MARIKIEWSVEAKLDLTDILEFYIARNGNSSYSKKLYSNTLLSGKNKELESFK